MNLQRLALTTVALATGAALAAAPGCVGSEPQVAAAMDAGGNDAPTTDSSAGGDAASDSSVDAGPGADADAGPRCNPATPFANVRLLDAINSPGPSTQGARLTKDEKTVYFSSSPRDGGSGSTDIFVSVRNSSQDNFPIGLPLNASPPANDEQWPTVSADGLYAYSQNYGGSWDIRGASRASASDPFGPFTVLASLSSLSNENYPYVLPNNNALYFVSDRDGGPGAYDIYRATNGGGGFQNPQLLQGSGVNTADTEGCVAVTSDELALYFSSNRAPTAGGQDIWVARRSSTASAFGGVTRVTELSSSAEELVSWVSDDECVIVFSRNGAGGTGPYSVYIAERSQ